jgi:dTDP-4-dehydrorhamnose reductase
LTDKSSIIFTGGNGLLGSVFRKLRPDINYPSSAQFDVTNYHQMKRYLEANRCDLMIHAAATTSPPVVDREPLRAMQVNIIGTANVVKLCAEIDIRLIYLSTDYVFSGEKGDYKETDPVHPVNKYAWSKLGGECAVRMYDRSLIIRTSFGPDIFPYPKAFVDQWTSRESVSIIAAKIAALIDLDEEITGVIHIGGTRKTVYEYARGLDESKEIGKISIKDVNFAVPVDTSLNCDKHLRLTGE